QAPDRDERRALDDGDEVVGSGHRVEIRDGALRHRAQRLADRLRLAGRGFDEDVRFHALALGGHGRSSDDPQCPLTAPTALCSVAWNRAARSTECAPSKSTRVPRSFVTLAGSKMTITRRTRVP